MSSTVRGTGMTDPTEIAAFLAWLPPKDRIVHDLAVQMLKSRYTPERSNAWIRWKRSLTAASK
jgi:hypothetical protein